MERASTRRSSLNLSDLPKNVIQEILCLLPIKEAGRTSILSRSWRYRWRSIPNLSTFGLYPIQIYQLLHLHSGSIRLFRAEEEYVSPGRDVHYNEWDDSDIVRWIHTLSQHSASTLNTLCLTFYNPHCYIDCIASSLPNLTHLHFTGSMSVYPRFGFPSLKSLFLHVSECSDDLKITGCPLLEDLHVTFRSKSDGERMILDIDAPSLRWLKLSKLAINNITVTSAPVLEIASILSCYYDVNDEEKEEEDDKNSVSGIRNDILMQIFGGMTSIRELKLDKEFVLFLGSGHVAERIPTTFGNLKAVYLSADFGLAKTLLGVLCLLGSTPVLQSLRIRVHNCSESLNEVLDAGHGFWEAQEHQFNKLAIVIMTNLACRKNEVDFIKFLLAKAEFLKSIVLSFSHLVKSIDSFMDELLEFPRLSHQAQFLLTRYPVTEEEDVDFSGAEVCCYY